ncbi:MAG: hypothetical protein J6S63_01350 [Atopobiaceae bacterium]|nr:hypothetical protein [Atopobiaceae bacterium]
MAKAKKPTRNTTAQYTAKTPTVRYLYDAGDDRRGLSRQPAIVANEIIRVAIRVEEDGEHLNVWQVNGSWAGYFLADFDKAGGDEEQV